MPARFFKSVFGAVCLLISATGFAGVAPSITTQPKSLSVLNGKAAGFSVVASGDAPLSYQWNFNGVAISGATSSAYSISAVKTSNTGDYTVVVSNASGSVTSLAAHLTVNTVPWITAQPASKTVNSGSAVSLSVTATGTAPLSYQWYQNGTAVSGATSATYSLSAASLANAGSYYVMVKNPYGAAASSYARLTVNGTPPSITTQPASVSVLNGKAASFSVTASGDPTLSYQWNFNGTAISGATSSTYSISAVSTSNRGNYSVIVSNPYGSVTSSNAVLTVNTAPWITVQPVSKTVNAGSPVSLSVTATGSSPLSYQWIKDGTAVSGATSSTYSLSSATSANAGSYYVVVKNPYGASSSSYARITVNTVSPSPSPSPSPTPSPTPTNGNTVGKTYYVSPNGSDSNDGLSQTTAWQTVAKVNASQFGVGDWVLFQGGASFTGCLKLTSSNIAPSPTSPFKIGSYGTGKFTLTANCSGDKVAAVDVSSLNGFTLENAIVVGNSGGAQYGVFLHNTTTNTAGNMTVQNSEITGFYAPSTSNFGAEIFISGLTGALTNVNILNNLLHGDTPSSLDDNGVSGYGYGKNIKNVVYRGNQIYNIGGKANGVNGSEGNGIVANGVDGAVMEYNIVHDVGGNVTTCGGAAGLWAYSANNITIQRNEVYNVRPITYTAGCDWDGFDLDGKVTNSVVQYNYSHDNYGAGYLAYSAGTWGPNVYRYNVSVNDANGRIAFGAFSMSNMGGAAPVYVYNNTFYSSSKYSTGVVFTNGSAETGYIANNVFYMTPGAYNVVTFLNSNAKKPDGLIFVNNDYFAKVGQSQWLFNYAGGYYGLSAWQATGRDAQSVAADPLFDNVGTDPLCNGYSTACATDYQLSSSSPVIGKGLDLTQAPYNLDIGTQDFWGNPLKHDLGTGYNMGAYGGK